MPDNAYVSIVVTLANFFDLYELYFGIFIVKWFFENFAFNLDVRGHATL